MEMKYSTELSIRIVAINTACAAAGITSERGKIEFGDGFRAAMDRNDLKGTPEFEAGKSAGNTYLYARETIQI